MRGIFSLVFRGKTFLLFTLFSIALVLAYNLTHFSGWIDILAKVIVCLFVVPNVLLLLAYGNWRHNKESQDV